MILEVRDVERVKCRVIRLSLLVVSGLFAPAHSFADSVTLAWDAPANPTNIAGYVIYYGTASGSYSTRVSVGNTNHYTVSNLMADTTYFFAATSLGTSGLESDYSAEVVYPPAVRILWPTTDLSHTTNLGSPATFSVSAVGQSPLTYQWYKGANALTNNLNLDGAASAILTIPSLTSADEGSYWVVVANSTSSATSRPMTLTVTAPLETKPPNVTVSPNSGFECETNNAMKVFGTAVDLAPGAVHQVLVQVNDGGWQSASMFKPVPQRAEWTNTVTLFAGTNKVNVKAVDSSGNVSKTVTRDFFLRIPSPLNVLKNGIGSADVTTQPPYFVGRSYSLQLTPGDGQLFSNVVAQTEGGSSILYSATPEKTAQKGARIRFTMQTNLTLVVNFIPNRFIEAAGTYYGLYHDPSAVAHQSAGFIKFKTDPKLKFTGALYVEGEKISFAGSFDLAGVGALKRQATRRGMMNHPIDIAPVIDLDGAERISGSVASPSWSATFLADLAARERTNALPANVAGQYTMILPGSTNATAEPGGDGYAVLTVQTNGSVATAGHSGDGEKVKVIKASVSKDGWWPFYAPLYKYYRPATNPPTATGTTVTYNGSISGWLLFTNGNVQGDLAWSKVRWTNSIYHGGFTNLKTVQGSSYTPPTGAGQHLLQITNGLMTFLDGNLAAPITATFWWNDLNRIVFNRNDNPNAIRLLVKVRDGSFSGAFVPDTNAPTVVSKVYGAVLQNANVGRGNFKGASQSGRIWLQGN